MMNKKSEDKTLYEKVFSGEVEADAYNAEDPFNQTNLTTQPSLAPPKSRKRVMKEETEDKTHDKEEAEYSRIKRRIEGDYKNSDPLSKAKIRYEQKIAEKEKEMQEKEEKERERQEKLAKRKRVTKRMLSKTKRGQPNFFKIMPIILDRVKKAVGDK